MSWFYRFRKLSRLYSNWLKLAQQHELKLQDPNPGPVAPSPSAQSSIRTVCHKAAPYLIKVIFHFLQHFLGGSPHYSKMMGKLPLFSCYLFFFPIKSLSRFSVTRWHLTGILYSNDYISPPLFWDVLLEELFFFSNSLVTNFFEAWAWYMSLQIHLQILAQDSEKYCELK